MLTTSSLGLRLCFAGLDALEPRVIELGVTSTATVSEPRPTATATTPFARFLDGSTLGAHRACGRRRGCWCLYLGISHLVKEKRENSHCMV